MKEIISEIESKQIDHNIQTLHKKIQYNPDAKLTDGINLIVKVIPDDMICINCHRLQNVLQADQIHINDPEHDIREIIQHAQSTNVEREPLILEIINTCHRAAFRAEEFHILCVAQLLRLHVDPIKIDLIRNTVVPAFPHPVPHLFIDVEAGNPAC